MNVSKKLAITFALLSLEAVGLGYAASVGAVNPLALAILSTIGIAISVTVAILTGRSVDTQLGASASEIHKKAEELASGYLAPLDSGDLRPGAAGELDLAVAQLNSVFRASRDTAQAIGQASIRLRSMTLLGAKDGGDCSKKLEKIGAEAALLESQAKALEEAIGYYSFVRESLPEEEEVLAEGRKRTDRKAKQKTQEQKATRHHPSKGHKPHLVLIHGEANSAEGKRVGGMDSQVASKGSSLRLMAPEENKE